MTAEQDRLCRLCRASGGEVEGQSVHRRGQDRRWGGGNCPDLFQGSQQAVAAVFQLGFQGGSRNDGDVTSGEGGAAGMESAVGEAQPVGKHPRAVPLKICITAVAQRPQDEGEILRGIHIGAAAEGSGAGTGSQSVGIGVAYIGHGPGVHIGKGDVPLAGFGFRFFAQQTHQHGHGLLPGGQIVQRIDGTSAGGIALSLEETKTVQLVCCGGGFAAGRCGGGRKAQNQHKTQKQGTKTFHGRTSCLLMEACGYRALFQTPFVPPVAVDPAGADLAGLLQVGDDAVETVLHDGKAAVRPDMDVLILAEGQQPFAPGGRAPKGLQHLPDLGLQTAEIGADQFVNIGEDCLVGHHVGLGMETIQTALAFHR